MTRGMAPCIFRPMKTAQASFFSENSEAQTLTPMMQQYWELKNAHPECLLFFRMGDFYELFFEDAIKAAPVLDIALTRRGKEQGEDVAMCGVPVHAYEAYLPKLIRAGFRVAIAEQMEDPEAARARAKAQKGGKALVMRQIIRIITPGTLTEDSFLDSASANYLAVLAEVAGELSVAWCDLAQGIPVVQSTDWNNVSALLSRLNPSELVISEKIKAAEAQRDFLDTYKDIISFAPSVRFDSESAKRAVLRQYSVTSLDSFGSFSKNETTALGVLLDYIALTQKQQVSLLQPPRLASVSGVLAIDAATRRNLELTQSLDGARKGSLLATIDRTKTNAGARLLAEYLAAPLTDVAAIEARLSRVEYFVQHADWREALRAMLKACPDLPRALTRLSLGRGSPRDLAIVRVSLESATKLRFFMNQHAHELNDDLKALSAELGEHSSLIDILTRALTPELPFLARDGGFIAQGFHAQLDELVSLRDDSKKLIAGLQNKYVQQTKIQTLKIRHNNVIGYHVDITPTQADKLLQPPFNQDFIHRQTLSSAVRFTTNELAELERKTSEAGDKALQIELQLFDELVQRVLSVFEVLRKAANAMAQLDVATALADLAHEQNWCKPVLDNSAAFEIIKGRHPVVEASLKQHSKNFIANDCDLSADSRLWLVTGPNMAGKSTFLRQNAILVVLAQAGSFVPASSAHIGIVDKLFSRVGAADDLARGRSTFMVEMIETAAILHQATPKSLVILDEIGRGTATFDGLSIAWGSLEYLYHHNQCRGLFATHYHELTVLREQLPSLRCATAKVKEWNNEIIFLHEVGEGIAESSYGIHVAQLAGLPAPVIAPAGAILQQLQEGQHNKTAITPSKSQDFTAKRVSEKSALDKAFEVINPDELTPREALEKLYMLKKIVG